MESISGGWRRRQEPDPEEELRKTELALRQLERAELYVVSAINLELDDWDRRLALHQLRCEVLAVCDLLRRPKPLG